MKGIGGNVTATLQISETETNAIGEQVRTWADLKTLTGWLDLTGGDSLDSNIQLVFNNARLGAAAAVELSKLEK